METIQRARRRARVQAAFREIDTNGDGTIDLEEATRILGRFGVSPERATARHLIDRFDRNGDGRLDVAEFERLFDTCQLEALFDALDDDGSGVIEVKELRQLFARFGVEMGRAQMDQIVAALDLDLDGGVSKDEFLSAFQHLPALDLRSLGQEMISLSSLEMGGDMPVMPPPHLPLPTYLLAGGLGGVASKSVTAPLERVKIVAQTRPTRTTTAQIAAQIVREEGWRGLFRGNTAEVLRVFPFAGLVCFSYTLLVGWLPAGPEYDGYEPVWRFVSGGLAGCLATCCTYPLDVLRARLATQKERGMRVLVRECVRGGLTSTYRGLAPTLWAIAPFIAVQQSLYDMLKKSLLHYYLPSVPLFLGCGVVAGAAAHTLTYPLDIVRRRMQTTMPPVTGSSSSSSSGSSRGVVSRSMSTTRQAIRQLYAQEGLRGFTRGLIPATLKIAPSVAISLLVRDACLQRLHR